MPPVAAIPTNQPKICNLPSKFIDRLNPLKQKKFSGFSVLFSSPPPRSSAKRLPSRCEESFVLARHLSRLHCSAPHSRSLPSCDTAGISAYTFGFSHKGLPLRSPRLSASQKCSVCVCDTFLALGQASRTKALSRLCTHSPLSPALPLFRLRMASCRHRPTYNDISHI